MVVVAASKRLGSRECRAVGPTPSPAHRWDEINFSRENKGYCNAEYAMF